VKLAINCPDPEQAPQVVKNITCVDRCRVGTESIAEHLAQVVRTELALELASN
jgi:hypothetical protein